MVFSREILGKRRDSVSDVITPIAREHGVSFASDLVIDIKDAEREAVELGIPLKSPHLLVHLARSSDVRMLLVRAEFPLREYGSSYLQGLGQYLDSKESGKSTLDVVSALRNAASVAKKNDRTVNRMQVLSSIADTSELLDSLVPYPGALSRLNDEITLYWDQKELQGALNILTRPYVSRELRKQIRDGMLDLVYPRIKPK